MNLVAVRSGPSSPPKPPAVPPNPRDAERDLLIVLLSLDALLAILHFPMVFWRNVNWDEFRFLSVIHDLQRGTLSESLQTIHARLFLWLPSVPGAEIDQVIAARTAYFGLLIVSCFAVYAIARTFVSRVGASFVVLCLLSFSEMIAHATSFRFDGLAVCLLLVALALLLRSRSLAVAAAAGMLTGAAVMVTIKSVLYLPVLALAVVLRCSHKRVVRGAIYAGAAAGGFLILYALHQQGLQQPAVADDLAFVRGAGEKVITWDLLLPRRRYLFQILLLNPVIWLCMVGGVSICLLRLRRRPPADSSAILLALLIPLSAVALYRNAFPYFYVFVVPPALVLCGVYFDSLVARSARPGLLPPGLPAAVVLFVILGFALNFSRYAADETQAQREVIAAVHELFPAPVHYIDRSSMIASFPKSGFFMSSWGLENYHAVGRPIFHDILRLEQPKFLLANHPALLPGTAQPSAAELRLLHEDSRVLQDHFVHHWGPIYIAGKRVVLGDAEDHPLEILIGGEYVLESTAPVRLNGVVHRPGSRLLLTQGVHLLSGGTGKIVGLRYGGAGRPPSRQPPSSPLFTGF